MATSKPARVLVAEDEWLVRALTVEMLEEHGFEVLEAADGLTALDLLEYPDHVALVVTDIRMPGADGIALARKARAVHPGIPLLFLTATPDLLDDHLDLAPYECMSKPFNLFKMVETAHTMVAL